MKNYIAISKKNLYSLLSCLFLLLTISACQCNNHTTKTASDHLQTSELSALDFARKYLAHEGILVQQSDGYAYLKVDDRYIHELFPLLHAEKSYKKPAYFRRPDSPGAHISIIYKNEGIKLKEVGQKFTFILKDIITIKTDDNRNYIILEVEAPALEELRKNYGLGPKLNGHQFHISIAKKLSTL